MIYKQIIEKIEQYDTIIIHGHIRPDGDCYGSQFGLQEVLKTNYPNKAVYVVGQTTDFVSFLGTPEEISDETYKGALAIVVDTGSAERISDQRYKTADYVIKIDHHIADEHYGDLVCVFTHYPACCQIVADIVFSNNLIVNQKAAFAFYTGLVTDTGRYRYRGVDQKTFEIAGLLMNCGVDIEKLDGLLSVENINVLKLKGYVLLNFETTKDGVAYIKMSKDIVQQYGVSNEEAANMVNLIGTLEGYPTWFLVMDYPNEIRIRIRSRGPLVDKLANKYQGGGHAKASGAKLNSWDELPQFIEDINELVREYKTQQ